MKITITINIGNYQSIRIESSEGPMDSQCWMEIKGALENLVKAEPNQSVRRTYQEWLDRAERLSRK